MLINRFSVRKLLDQIDLRLRHRVPLIHQTESSECGLACLAMICGAWGKNVDMIALRQRFNMSARGTTLAGLKGVAAQLELTTRALSLDLNGLSSLKTPCILHWNFDHFVVLVSVRRKSVVLHDPMYGRRVVRTEELSRSFTGVALEVWPDSNFRAFTENNRLDFRKLAGGVNGIKGALGKIFCLSLVIETINLVMPVGTQLVMDHAIPAGDRGLLTLICSGLMVFILLRTATGMVRAWSSLVMSTLINVQWQSGLFSHLLRLPLSYFERRKLGDIQSRFGSLDTLRSTFTTSIVGAIMDAIMVTSVLIMMMLYGGWLTCVVTAFTSLYVLLRLLTYGHYRELSEAALLRKARADSYFMETLYGIAAVKMQGMTERRSAQWLNLEIETVNTGIRITKMDMLFGGINSFITACDQIVVLWLGVSLVIDNQMTIGMFVAFGAFRGQFSERVKSLTEYLLQLRMMSLHNERVADIALNSREAQRADNPRINTSGHPVTLRTVSLSYAYDSQHRPVFTGIDIRIEAGECVAITGPSGVGKTTLMKVLCGLFEPTEGKVLVNETDICQMGVNNYRKLTGCIMQEDRLFSGSVRENICGFVGECDEEWMVVCAQSSCIHETIMALPMGYDTLTGELGEGLSGGQKQRIFIARALYRKPGILFMDEATSALDSASEAAVNESIRKMNITRIIIAHRPSTIAAADRIIDIGELIKT